MTVQDKTIVVSYKTKDQKSQSTNNNRKNMMLHRRLAVSASILVIGLSCVLLGLSHQKQNAIAGENLLKQSRIDISSLHETTRQRKLYVDMEETAEEIMEEESMGENNVAETMEGEPGEGQEEVEMKDPSAAPSMEPSMIPSMEPSMIPSTIPSEQPTDDPARLRCELVVDIFDKRDVWMNEDAKMARHDIQSRSMDSFLESNIHLFWYDFRHTYNITERTLEMVDKQRLQVSREFLSGQANSKLLWTWVNGDQHFHNFQSGDNRRGNIVFGPARYEETAIFDFQIDILRMCLTAYHVAVTKQGMDENSALKTVTNSLLSAYVKAVREYNKDPDQATGFHLVNDTASEGLKDYLNQIYEKKNLGTHLEEFTELVGEERQFKKGSGGMSDTTVGGVHHSSINYHQDTFLAQVSAAKKDEIENAFTEDHYGASMMKLGWKIKPWNETDVRVMDVAARYVEHDVKYVGLERYYVFLDTYSQEGDPVILDLIEQPRTPPIWKTQDLLSKEEEAWYGHLFRHSGDRVVRGERETTTYTDPYLGWVLLSDGQGGKKPFSVRRHSPWRSDAKVLNIKDNKSFQRAVGDMAKLIAANHVRGSVAKSPAHFHVVAGTYFDESKGIYNDWNKMIASVTQEMYGRYLADHACFHEHVATRKRRKQRQLRQRKLQNTQGAGQIRGEPLFPESGASVPNEPSQISGESPASEHDPTQSPTSGPTNGPTAGPTSGPTSNPTAGPTNGPTAGPTSAPTGHPLVKIDEGGERDDWVAMQFDQRDFWMSTEARRERYEVQGLNIWSFLRSSNHLYLKDFVRENLAHRLLEPVKKDAYLLDNVTITPRSTWTWVSGDQHLENFGVYQNHNGDVVFGMNDFDEGAIYDFQVDVLRFMVSAWLHAAWEHDMKVEDIKTNLLPQYTKAYIDMILKFYSNPALLRQYKADDRQTKGEVQWLIKDVKGKASVDKQIQRFTNIKEMNGMYGIEFIKGTVDEPDDDTKLGPVSESRDRDIREVFDALNYGATMTHVGWKQPTWVEDDHFYNVIDVAKRISGTASYGVDRYYVLLQDADSEEFIILDVKQQTRPAIRTVLEDDEMAWYDTMFPNEAIRAITAEREMNLFFDIYLGWVNLSDSEGNVIPYSVRRRSPFKKKPEKIIEKNLNVQKLGEILVTCAEVMAAGHARGSVAKPPGDFKTVIHAIFYDDDRSVKDGKLETWTTSLIEAAESMIEQLEMDYESFQKYVAAKFR